MLRYRPKPFKISKIDQWGNVFMYCPVCNCEFKEDGVLKHISAMHGGKYKR